MLETSNYNKNEVITVKLTSGEEVLGRFVEQDQNSITLAKAHHIIPNQNGLGIAPFAFGVDINTTNIKINRTQVVFEARTMKQIADQYTQATSGIQMVDSAQFGVQNAGSGQTR